MPSLISFATVSECIHYFKGLPVDSQCILTGGPQNERNSRTQFLRRGLRVGVRGPFGNRTVTNKGVDMVLHEKYSELRRSKDKDGVRITLGEAGGKILKPGESVFANGSRNTIVRELIRAYGSGNYSCAKAEHPKYGVGCMVTHLSEEQKQARDSKKAILRAASPLAEGPLDLVQEK